MGRAPCCDKANVKKGPWSPEEDAKLKEYIKINGTGGNWISLPSKAGLKRCGKSCRLRWINYLRPDIKHGSFTEEEENTIYRLHHTIGSRWSLIAAQLPGRTDNDIKNYWNTRLKKKLAERGMDMQHNQRNNHMQNIQNIQNLVSQFPGLQNGPVDNPLYDPSQMMNYCALRQQQEMDALLRGSQSVSLPTFSHQQQHLHQPMMPVKEELVSARTGLQNAGIDERLLMIESSLRSCISTPVVPNTMAPLANVQAISVLPPAMAPMSPVPVEQSHHQSPTSSCSGLSSDRSYGGQLADSAYSESFSNSYEDPTCFSDSQRSSLLSAPSLLPPPPQIQSLETARKSHSSGSAFAPERFGLEEAFPSMESYRPGPMEAPVDRQGVKEELSTDWWSGVVSPRTPRTSMCSKWFVPSPRCGAENVFSVQNPAIQSASTMSLEACLDPYAFSFKNNYVAI